MPHQVSERALAAPAYRWYRGGQLTASSLSILKNASEEVFAHLPDHYIRTDTNMHTWAAALRERTQQPQQQGAGRENARGEGMATSDAAEVLLLLQAWTGGRLEEPRWQAD